MGKSIQFSNRCFEISAIFLVAALVSSWQGKSDLTYYLLVGMAIVITPGSLVRWWVLGKLVYDHSRLEKRGVQRKILPFHTHKWGQWRDTGFHEQVRRCHVVGCKAEQTRELA
jgi:hypothetical protein